MYLPYYIIIIISCWFDYIVPAFRRSWKTNLFKKTKSMALLSLRLVETNLHHFLLLSFKKEKEFFLQYDLTSLYLYTHTFKSVYSKYSNYRVYFEYNLFET